jgi:phosphomevalonate kinase
MATVVSCPGKVLLAGGYLVLEPKYQGLVVSTSSRFYTCIDDSPDTTNLTAVDPSTYRVIVRSPQFEAAEWIYDVTLDGGKASGSTKATVGQTNSIKLQSVPGSLQLFCADYVGPY